MKAVHGAAFEVAPLRVPEGLIVYLKHLETAWVFRIVPIRDPDQPRLWCLRLEACASASLSARTAPLDPFYTSLAMTREQLAETLTSLRQRTEEWLDDARQDGLRRWLGSVVRQPVPANFAAPSPAMRSRASSTAEAAGPAGS
jgi:hypothetical protein